ncbi:MAG: hypothetical protein HC801_09440 [Nitrospira sp.]|nr:hypothetical protein [Nitrospira sp.]
MRYHLAAPCLTLVVVSGIVLGAFSATESAQSGKRPGIERGVVQVGDEAPNFTLRDLTGKVMSLSQLQR